MQSFSACTLLFADALWSGASLPVDSSNIGHCWRLLDAFSTLSLNCPLISQSDPRIVRKTLAPKMRPSRHEMNRPCCLSALLIYPAVQSASAAGCSCNTTVTAQRWQMLDGIVYRLLARLVLTPAQEGNPNQANHEGCSASASALF